MLVPSEERSAETKVGPRLNPTLLFLLFINNHRWRSRSNPQPNPPYVIVQGEVQNRSKEWPISKKSYYSLEPLPVCIYLSTVLIIVSLTSRNRNCSSIRVSRRLPTTRPTVLHSRVGLSTWVWGGAFINHRRQQKVQMGLHYTVWRGVEPDQYTSLEPPLGHRVRHPFAK